MHYMYMQDGPNAGYFAWSCQTDGTPNANGPAPDGEEYFAMALFLRRGAGAAAAESMITPPWPDASCTAACIRAKSPARAARCGTPRTTLSNLSPSVILPIRPTICPTSIHCSRCGPTRRIARSGPRLPGLAAHFSIKRATRSRVSAPSIPSTTVRPTTARTVTSATTCITAMPTAPSPTWRWTTPGSGPTRGRPKTPSGCKIFCETLCGRTNGIWEIDGTPLPGEALHPVAITATNAQASLAAGGPNAEVCVRRFWNTPLRDGPRRYYDNCLYFFALLALSGRYRIWPL